MSKKRRTRKENIKALTRNEPQMDFGKFEPATLKVEKKGQTTTPLASTTSSIPIAYVIHDIKKTIFITFALILLNIIFYIFWKTNILRFSFLEI